MALERRTIRFSGRVQGVGFRATAQHLAADLALFGTVENLAEGDVELVAEGAGDQIDLLISRLREHFGTFLRKVEQRSSAATGTSGKGIRIVQ
jgi:acylphosphatase